ncbi:M67 family metallopeptidase [Magnetofaba australis]|uniref:Putative Mov34/MPN/PAD-1 family protein n=1 Tax=Magnetofaba australis IT-1 TaxID=1434232 RepID=A0A1Y2JZN7_9PROT|nr:M67 family metallopeptidase [Magnetofaba australis]OSM00316.1 putative Mov34/MPN/PAD-1 family protein [Magnetofaba australis IT-1]
MTEIPRVIVNKMLTHAQRALPKECVGLLSGADGRIDGWKPLPNVLDDERRFFADPQALIDAMRTLREESRELMAIYHSHPTGPAMLSQADIEQANYPDALYLIVSLGVNGCLDMHGFRFENGQPQEVEIAITE